MPSLRPRFFLIALSFFLVALFPTLLSQQAGNDGREGASSVSRPAAPGPSPSRQEKTALEDLDDHPALVSLWSPVLRSSAAAPSESKAHKEAGSLYREEVQEYLSSVIEDKFPDLGLSERDLYELTEAVRTIQSSMEEMRGLERIRSNTGALLRARADLYRAAETFAEITKMDLAEFILRGRLKGGIDHEEFDGGEIVQEYLSDFEP